MSVSSNRSSQTCQIATHVQCEENLLTCLELTDTKPAFLRAAYCRLTGDASAASTEQAEVDVELLNYYTPKILTYCGIIES